MNVGRLHFVKFSTDAIDQLVHFIKTKLFAINRLATITATGTG
jgi:hypothetical protein